MLIEDNYALPTLLGRVSVGQLRSPSSLVLLRQYAKPSRMTDREDAARTMVHIFEAKQNVTEFLKAVISTEVASAGERATLDLLFWSREQI
jgi:hypothetical protein